MKVVLQRSLNSSVSVNEKVVGKIDKGLVIFVCFTDGDNEYIIDKMINKILKLRIFDDDKGIMNKSINDIGGSILSISQFTLYADTKKGNRPSYMRAMNGQSARKLYETFNDKLRSSINVETGMFGSDMSVSITNDGPVTIIIESEDL